MAFVEYGDAESVLRALEVVHGAQIKTRAGAGKALLVKADEKTRGRLDEYEKERVKAEVRLALSIYLSQSLSLQQLTQRPFVCRTRTT